MNSSYLDCLESPKKLKENMFLKGLLKLIEQLKSAIYPCFFAYRLSWKWWAGNAQWQQCQNGKQVQWFTEISANTNGKKVYKIFLKKKSLYNSNNLEHQCLVWPPLFVNWTLFIPALFSFLWVIFRYHSPWRTFQSSSFIFLFISHTWYNSFHS